MPIVSEPVRDHAKDRPAREVWAFRAEPWLLVGLGVVLALLAQFFPPSGDDWAWGSEDGAARYHRWFDHYNGRWAGNLLVLALTRLTWLAPLVIALTACVLVHLVTRVAGLRTPAGYLATIALFVAMPLAMWRQAMVWVSGFSNYVPATVCLLLFVACVQRDWSGTPWRRPLATGAGVAAVAFVAALFMEHVTVVLILAATAHLVLLRLRGGARSLLVPGAWLIGLLAGAVLMFSNSIYRSAAEGADTYQKVNISLLQILTDGVTGVSALSVGMNAALNSALVLVLAGLWAMRRGTQAAPAGGRWGLAAVVAGAVGLVSGVVISSQVTGLHYFGALNGWGWMSSVGMLVALVLGALHLVDDRERRRTVLLLTAMAFLLIAPATVVQPFTPRVFFPAYVLMTVIFLILLRELTSVWAHPWVQTAVMVLSSAVAVGVLGTYFVVYSRIDHAEQERIATIREQVADGATQVWVPHLPYVGFVHYPDPRMQVYQQRFKEYYGLPDDLVLVNEPRP